MKTFNLKVYSSVLISALLSTSVAKADLANVCTVRGSALNYILQNQVSADDETYKTGEWTSQIKMGGFPLALGILKNGPFEDANAFTVSNVQNSLAEIYLKHKKDPRIPPALAKARYAFKRYKMDSGGYNFWPKNAKAGKNGHLPAGVLTSNIFDGLVTIPADADDTSLVYLSLLLDEQILGPEDSVTAASVRSENFENIFARYRDKVRIGLPDFWAKKKLYSGAYLTWLKASPIIPLITSALVPQSEGPRVVLGLNIVDCVVNANVLRTLSAFDKNDTKGFKKTCEYLNDMARKKRYNSCGVYYPDTYWMHYTMARAYEDGASCLSEGVARNLEHLLTSQQENGSWHNKLADNDDILATGLALGALLKTGDKQNVIHQQAVRKGLDFLLAASSQHASGETHWKGGVFFSGGVLVRKKVLWTSDAYTTSVITQTMYEAEKWFPSELKCSI